MDITWSKITRPGVEGVYATVRQERPAVYLEVVAVPGQMMLERRAYAVFKWPGRQPQPLVLRRDSLPIGGNLKDPLKIAKEMIIHEWAEDVAMGVPGVLAEMWAEPMMSQAERIELIAKRARMNEEAKERAHKTLLKRQEQAALQGRRT